MTQALLTAWRAHGSAPGVLVTVLHVEGSAYRRPGARMLILPDGRRFGTISGGCLEADVARKAAWWTAAGYPVVRVYDTSSGDDIAWEFGLGCQGVVHLLLEPCQSPAALQLREQLDHPAPQVIATVLHASAESPYRVGDHFYSSQHLPEEFATAAEAVLAAQRSRLLRLPHTSVFLEYSAPAPHLVILGAGHDVVPVVAAARSLGWRVTVADPRPAYALAARFEGAQVGTSAPLDDATAIVLMTHNFPLDVQLLPQALAAQPRYLGILGPWSRTERLFRELGHTPPAGLHAPIGLDLGGDAPESVALAIVGEIQAVLHGRTGACLSRLNVKAIHDPVEVMARAETPLPQPDRVELSHCELVSAN